jgi:catechol 2,3-dioxygenase-like lactoylglutathione lyase family enzyme
MTVGEINIICTDLDRSLAFYRDALGFEVIEQEGPAYHLRCGEARFLLLGVAESPRELRSYCQSPEFSIDLITDDLSGVVERLRRQGVNFVSEFAPSAKRAFIRDPDGLVFEIIQN